MRGVVVDVQAHPYVPRGRILFLDTTHFRFDIAPWEPHEILVVVPPGEPLLLDEAMKLIGEVIEV